MDTPTRDAIQQQMDAWPHLQQPEYAAHRAVLLSCAEALDLMLPQIRAGRVPPMQAVTAGKALFSLLRQIAPEQVGIADAGFIDVELPLFDNE